MVVGGCRIFKIFFTIFLNDFQADFSSWISRSSNFPSRIKALIWWPTKIPSLILESHEEIFISNNETQHHFYPVPLFVWHWYNNVPFFLLILITFDVYTILRNTQKYFEFRAPNLLPYKGLKMFLKNPNIIWREGRIIMSQLTIEGCTFFCPGVIDSLFGHSFLM
jgi:hypothetical protein